VLTLLPGDVGTPVADQFAEMSKYFLLILSILYLEKYLISITGYVAFTVLVPVVCAVLIGYICTNKKALLKMAGKILLCALAIFAVIPASVKISDVIYQTQETSINSTIEEMNSLDSSADESGSILDTIKETANNAKNLLSGMVTDLIESLAVMLTITCLIPVLVFLFFVWLIKMVFNSMAIHMDDEAVRRITKKTEIE
jgi:predicted PurR-regulated permease PerM